ncbi:MAG: chalcone isomerase family protein [Pseudomonas sp.]
MKTLERQGFYRLLLQSLMVFCISFADAHAGWKVDVPHAQMIGKGDFRWFGFPIYSARLWGQGRPASFEQPFALELIYRREIKRDALVQTSLDEIRRMLGARFDEQKLSQWRRQMQQAFVDVEPGKRITGVYLPGLGCRFYVNEQLQHEVADLEFARAFFSIWLGPQTRSPQLREELLGLNAESEQ